MKKCLHDGCDSPFSTSCIRFSSALLPVLVARPLRGPHCVDEALSSCPPCCSSTLGSFSLSTLNSSTAVSTLQFYPVCIRGVPPTQAFPGFYAHITVAAHAVLGGSALWASCCGYSNQNKLEITSFTSWWNGEQLQAGQ